MATKNPEKRTAIKIKESTHKKLKKLASYGETMDDVINRALRVDGMRKTKKESYEDKI